jgi:uncharacterized protein YPO0396
MKKLTNIKLINWAGFSNETIPFNGNVFIMGDNAAGKTTLIDALLYCLTTSDKDFNKAARGDSTRDVKRYVRGIIGIENRESLRNGYVTSYIALEFLDDIENQKFTIGVKIDSPDKESKTDSKWFYIKDDLEIFLLLLIISLLLTQSLNVKAKTSNL